MKKLFLFSLSLASFIVSGCTHNTNKNKPADTINPPDIKKENPPATQQSKMKYIVFYGNSITAGYGLDQSEAFPALIQARIDSLALPYKVINAGLSGETSAGGNSRVDWLLQQRIDIFVLELGGNDGLRGISITETSKNLQAIIDKVKGKYPSAKLVLAGMQIPPNMGQAYSSDFRKIFSELAQKNKTSLIPFILEGVGGVPELNQADGIHPTAQGHKIVAENVWKALQVLL